MVAERRQSQPTTAFDCLRPPTTTETLQAHEQRGWLRNEPTKESGRLLTDQQSR